MKGLARGCGGKRELGPGLDFQAPLLDLRTDFSHFCTKLRKTSAQLVASLQLREIQLRALPHRRDAGTAGTREASLGRVGVTRRHRPEALEMTSAVV